MFTAFRACSSVFASLASASVKCCAFVLVCFDEPVYQYAFFWLLLYSSRGTAVSKSRKEIADSIAWFGPTLDSRWKLSMPLQPAAAA